MKLVECTTCGSLKDLQSIVDCVIFYYINKRYSSLIYNTEVCQEDRLIRDLLRYKRIIGNRLYDSTYPCSSISVNDIITQASLKATPEIDCDRCVDCDAEILDSTTTTTSTTTTSTTTTSTTTTIAPVNCSRYRIAGDPDAPIKVNYNYKYSPCGIDHPTPITAVIKNIDTIDLCCVPDSIEVDPFFTVTLLNPICIP